MKLELSMPMFMALLLVVGLTLTVYSFILASDVTNCSASAQNAVRGLLVMGVLLFSVSGTLLAFNCSISNKKGFHSILGTSFMVILLVICVTTIGLVSTIHKECMAARNKTPVLLGLSVLVTVITSGYLGYEGYKMIIKKQFVPGKTDETPTPSTTPSSPTPSSMDSATPSASIFPKSRYAG